MNTRVLFVVVFIAGLGSGWAGKTWLGPFQSKLATIVSGTVTGSNQAATILNDDHSQDSTSVITSTIIGSNNDVRSTPQNTAGSYSQVERSLLEEQAKTTSVVSQFQRLLNERLYFDAMVLYQEQELQNGQAVSQLKSVLLDRLKLLSKNRNNSDFSELIDNYLAVYYDDIDVLVLLADFNQSNGSYLEAVDVYLLAKTYAYTDSEQQKVLVRFDNFVKGVDSLYTNQKNWLSLINLYSHISTLGLMTSPYQYRQALAHLRSGDEYFAVEQFRQLLNDTLVGESAAIALNKLTENTGTVATPTIASSAWEGSESVALEKRGNQYLVNLTVNRQDGVKLLIDTGASITTLSRASFDSLTTNGDVEEIDRRVFRTAGGVVMGTVYSVPELGLGPYLIKNTQIAVIDFDVSRGFDGLLGMNVLGQFRFQIDQENASLLLSSK